MNTTNDNGSHMIVTLNVSQKLKTSNDGIWSSKLHFCDLAGSEYVTMMNKRIRSSIPGKD